MENVQNSISSTLAYFHVFHYAPTVDELYLFLHSSTPVTKAKIQEEIIKEKRLINNHIFFLPEFNQKTKTRKNLRRKNLRIQAAKAIESAKKFLIAEDVACFLSRIPTVNLISVSGNLAMGNAAAEDDIDFFIITAPHTAWITRFMMNIMLIVKKQKRMFGDLNVKNKICLNLFLDEFNLELKKKNLFTAHEIAQMKIIYEKNHTQRYFLLANSWIKDYLANFWQVSNLSNQEELFKQEASFLEKAAIFLSRLFEPVTRIIQISYMKRRITHEIVKDGILMFHPRDYSREILSKHKKLLRATKM